MSSGNNKPNLNQLNRPTRAAGYSLMGIVLSLSVFFAIWIALYRQSRVVKTMQPIFLIPVCMGIFISTLSILPLGLDDGVISNVDTACMSIPWLNGIGISLKLSALFSKLWRVNKIVNGPSFQKKIVTAKDVMWPLLTLLSLNLIILVIWTIVDPVEWVREPVYGEDYSNTYGYCKDGTAGAVLHLLLTIVNAVALALMSIQAYKARNVSSELSEARSIGFAMFSWLNVYIVASPMLNMVSPAETAAIFITNVLVDVLPNLCMLLFVFFPIIQHHRKAPDQTKGNRIMISGIEANGSEDAQSRDNQVVRDLEAQVKLLDSRVVELEQVLSERSGITTR